MIIDLHAGDELNSKNNILKGDFALLLEFLIFVDSLNVSNIDMLPKRF